MTFKSATELRGKSPNLNQPALLKNMSISKQAKCEAKGPFINTLVGGAGKFQFGMSKLFWPPFHYTRNFFDPSFQLTLNFFDPPFQRTLNFFDPPPPPSKLLGVTLERNLVPD